MLIKIASFFSVSTDCLLGLRINRGIMIFGGMNMPEVSLFFGIRITMYYDDHNPPHFHAEYAGKTAIVDIQEGCILQGGLPSKQVKLILAWCEIHKDELMQNWELSKDGKPLNKINPLM